MNRTKNWLYLQTKINQKEIKNHNMIILQTYGDIQLVFNSNIFCASNRDEKMQHH